VNFRSEPEPSPAVAPIESDAPESFLFRELANRNLERLRGVVESQKDLRLDCGGERRDKRL
jgi:hypothetical protein